MKTVAKLNNLRVSPRKSKIVADLIRGMNVNDALVQLDIYVKRTSPYLKKLLLSAIANGENNSGIDKNNMYVYDVKVGAGVTFKRWRPKAFGRAGKILKRTSQVEIILEERVEGKNRKTKRQIEKEKKEKVQARRKLEKEAEKKKEQLKQENKKNKENTTEKLLVKKNKQNKKEEMKKNGETSKKEKQEKGWVKKVFRRKSM